MRKELKNIKQLLSIQNLSIPEFQRPYKWKLKHINQLVDDILKFKDKSAYRLGSIVIWNDKGEKDIVDGQQRITTLILLITALKENNNIQLLKEINLPKIKFSNSTSIQNIKQNYQELQNRTKEFDEKVINFLLNKCEVVYIELNDVDEAFQFFDSQNARGKELAPHDLLKAFHLREMRNIDEEIKYKLVQEWEKLDDENKLAPLFNNYLFKIRNWSRGKSARYFTTKHIDIFKGISLKHKNQYPYALIYQMADVFIDNYNNSSSKTIDKNKLEYPFSLDLPILNGKRFFEMITHYHSKIEIIKQHDNDIIKLLKDYEGSHRTGDKYTKLLFECALIFYIDKFGMNDIDRVIKKLFAWAYKLRLELQAVRLSSIDNKAVNSHIFSTIKNANTHYEVLNMNIENIKDINASKVDKIIEKLKNIGYYND